MSDQFNRLTAALADRYTIERELGAGGMSARGDFATDGERLYFTLEERQGDVFVMEIVTDGSSSP